jgi:hypothetical protein
VRHGTVVAVRASIMVKFGVLSSLLLVSLVPACDGPAQEELSSESSALSLPGSKFELDSSSNLVVDTAGNLDWASVEDIRRTDTASGANDNSFKGGSKEDDVCPPTETGSIPNNKSDLKTFGVYTEPGANPGDPGFLHMFWHRVQDPTGTTLMDFEFNQASAKCANGVNPVRSAGDLLIEYRLEQGGATATLKLREWTGTAWSAAADLTASGDAAGTINASAISAANADGLGAIDPRTFGEASVSLASIFQSDKCTTFGSAFVKSRSSDAFTSALKDFIAPIGVNITNCGKVVIRKKTEPAGSQDKFSFSHTLKTDPASSSSFQIGDGEASTITNVLFGNGYTVTEGSTAGYDLASIDCSASSGVTPVTNVAAGTVTFDIDSETDVVDCTYTNRAKGTLVVEKITSDGAGTFAFTSGQLGAFSLTTTAAGTGGKDSTTFADIAPGTYSVAEAVPAGWTLASATCSDGSNPASVKVDAGETVTCTFVNARVRGAVRIHKTRAHAAFGLGGTYPHPGVTFTVSSMGQASASVTTDANGDACVDGLLLSSFVGDYTVTETVPAGYAAAGATSKTVSIDAGGSCASGATTVSFHNLPLTNITVSVDSQVPGGSASTITCTPTGSATTGADGDGSLALTNLVAGTYTCTVVVKY